MQIDLAGSGAGVLNPTFSRATSWSRALSRPVWKPMSACCLLLFRRRGSRSRTCFVPGLCGSSGHRG